MKPFGLLSAVESLRQLDQKSQERILNEMAKTNPEVVKELRHFLILFTDIQFINPKGIEALMKETPLEKWYLALRATDKIVHQTLKSSMSERRWQMIEDQLKSMKPQPLSKVQEAQKEIINIIVKLQSQGLLVIDRKGSKKV